MKNSEVNDFSKTISKLIRLIWFLVITLVTCTFLNIFGIDWIKPITAKESKDDSSSTVQLAEETSTVVPTSEAPWQAPDSADIPDGKEGLLIRYGRELIVHTSVYLGPKGKVKPISNGMNCQNCHLDAGTKPFANNFALVNSRYPKLRKRSGIMEDYVYRVNGCFERSMNGQGLPADSREMKAIIAYLKWVGKDVKKEDKPIGVTPKKIPFLKRPADPAKGKTVYVKYCQICHGTNGEGLLKPDSTEYIYPPLYGKNSFNYGAGMYRLTQFAEYVKSNMPFGVSYYNPVLSDEEAWDVAAYVNSQNRPGKDLSKDWKNIADKPYDHPFGPFADGFSEEQHKYGPFEEIIAAKNE